MPAWRSTKTRTSHAQLLSNTAKNHAFPEVSETVLRACGGVRRTIAMSGLNPGHERDQLMRVQFDPDVTGVASQPFRITLPESLPQTSHGPDYLPGRPTAQASSSISAPTPCSTWSRGVEVWAREGLRKPWSASSTSRSMPQVVLAVAYRRGSFDYADGVTFAKMERFPLIEVIPYPDN